jgi:hypothetical protein
MKLKESIRWGTVLTWGLLAATAVGALIASAVLLPQWQRVRGESPAPAEVPHSVRATRPSEDTLIVPSRVLRSLGIRTTKAVPARRPRVLPSLTGTLAIDTNRLVRVHARFAGEVVQLGTASDIDPTKTPRSRDGRPYKYFVNKGLVANNPLCQVL